MKKILLLILFCFIIIPIKAKAEEVHIYLFYGSTCSICEAEREFLKNKNNVKIHEFEVYDSKENYNIMKQVKQLYSITKEGVPFTVVGDTAILGYNTSRQNRINKLIDKYSDIDYYDRVGVLLGLYEDEEIVKKEETIKENELDKKQDKKNNNIFWIYFGISVLIILVINYVYLYNKKLKKGE